jgi:hypothetical protein
MNISTIEQYVADKNKWAAIFKGRQLSLLVQADRVRIAQSLEADLSPENLTCDGEVRGTALRQKAAYLNRCVEELFSIDPTLTSLEY